jgi:RNA polymerase sigma-32 factor
MERQLAISDDAGLSHYLRDIRKFPMLQPQDEYALAKRWREHNDDTAAQTLVTSHLRLVAKIATGYRGYGIPLSELIADGNIGLMHAVKRFDPERGFRLTTYAMWWIKSAMHEYILRSWSMVRMGTSAKQKKLFFNLRKAKRRHSAVEEGDMHPEHIVTIARDLHVTAQDVVDMNRRLGRDASLNTPIRKDDGPAEWQDRLADEREDQEATMAEGEEFDSRRRALSDALSLLKPRERHIFEKRRLADEPVPLDELAREFGVSGERVRQIEVSAFRKVQKAVKAHVAVQQNPRASYAHVTFQSFHTVGLDAPG